MKIETKFDTGDVVHLITQAPTKTWEPCSFCSAKGRIEGADGESTTCPKCYGRGGTTVHGRAEWQVARTITIGEVKVRYRAEKSTGEDSEFDNYGHQEEEQEEEYMAYETGIGTGNNWYAANLFPTAEEALSACYERNAAERLEILGRID